MGELLLGLVVAAATAAGLVLAPRATAPARPRRWTRHPGTWLLVVTAAIYLNQVLFTIYLTRVWGGDPAFIAQHLPSGWFDLADRNEVIGRLAERFPQPELLSVSVLRVQAFLELPWVLLAYLTICRWFGPDLFRRTVGLLWPLSISYTVTFCLIEWSLPNPYTVDDIVLRAVSALIVPLLLTRLAEGDGASTPLGLAVFVVSAGSLGYLVLAVYDTALLYNLGHLAGEAPRMALAAAVLAAARFAASRIRPGQERPVFGVMSGALRWFLALFSVPALPIRYGLSFGVPLLSACAGTVIAVAAVVLALRGSTASPTSLAVVAVLASAGGGAGFLAVGGYPEARLLAAMCAFFAVAIATCAVLDRRESFGLP